MEEESSAGDVKDMLLEHCHEVLNSRPSSPPVLYTVAYLTLVDMIRGVCEESTHVLFDDMCTLFASVTRAA